MPWGVTTGRPGSSKLLRFLHQVGTIRIEIMQPRLQIGHTSRANAVAVFQCKKISDLQFRPQKFRFYFLVRSADVLTEFGRGAIEHSGPGYELDAVTRPDDAKESFPIIIYQ